MLLLIKIYKFSLCKIIMNHSKRAKKRISFDNVLTEKHGKYLLIAKFYSIQQFFTANRCN